MVNDAQTLNFIPESGMTGWSFSIAPDSDILEIGEKHISSVGGVLYDVCNIHTGKDETMTADEILAIAHRMYSPVSFLNYPKTDIGKVFLLVEALMAKVANNGD